MTGLPWIRIAAAGVMAAALIGAGWKVGYSRAETKIGREASELVYEARSERDAAAAEVAKVNEANAELERQKSSTLDNDRRATERAQKDLAASIKYVNEQQAYNLKIVQQAEEYLRNAEDACINAAVPDDFHRLLDELANPPGIVTDRVMPASAANRPPTVSQPSAGVPGDAGPG